MDLNGQTMTYIVENLNIVKDDTNEVQTEYIEDNTNEVQTEYVEDNTNEVQTEYVGDLQENDGSIRTIEKI
jgi:predicted Ser/Thr protein kinase